MRKDFKRAGYLLAILIFFLGISALVISSVINYFSYSRSVVVIGQFVTLIAFIALLVICILAKNNYNYVCTRFADYIIDSRKKEAEYQENEAEHIKQIKSIKSAAESERKSAVEAALERGRNEGAHAAMQAMGDTPTNSQNLQVNQDNQNRRGSTRSVIAKPRPIPAYMQPIAPNDEILYNQYGEPVMIRRRVRKNREHYDGEILYDRLGNPVARRTQSVWEIDGQQIQVSPRCDPPADTDAQPQVQSSPDETEQIPENTRQ